LPLGRGWRSLSRHARWAAFSASVVVVKTIQSDSSNIVFLPWSNLFSSQMTVAQNPDQFLLYAQEMK
jgi:hypothetical protein